MDVLIALLKEFWPLFVAIAAAIWGAIFGARREQGRAKAREDARLVEQAKARDEARRNAKDMTDADISDLLTGRRLDP